MSIIHDILKIRTKEQLSELLEMRYVNLVRLAHYPEYYKFPISKKSGGIRLILAPHDKHKKLQRRINHILQDLYKDMDLGCVYGFNSSQPEHIKANAANHINKKFVYNTDLKDFFPNISSVMVRDLFMLEPFNYNETLATLMAMLTTYEGALPTGAPSSPIISNLIFYRTDKKLKAFSESKSLSYSRYADDLTFSSNTDINQEIISQINQIIEENGFVINQKKSRLQKYYNRQIVTGLTVNQKVNINRKYIRNIRAILHDIKNRGLVLASSRFFDNESINEESTNRFLNILRGKIEFIGFVRGWEDNIYKTLHYDISVLLDDQT